jgi:hypothetical protein
MKTTKHELPAPLFYLFQPRIFSIPANSLLAYWRKAGQLSRPPCLASEMTAVIQNERLPMRSRALTYLKSAVLSDRAVVSTIRFGIFNGIQMMLRPVDSQQLRFGLWERETYKYIKIAAERSSWLIDIGASPGELSLFFSLKTQARSIVAIDPNVDLLLTNVALNQATRIEAIKGYAGRNTGQIALDDITVHRDQTGLIRIDAEGDELDILISGNAVLKEATPLLLIETHSLKLERECMLLLKSSGYDTTIIHNAWWRFILPERRPLEQNRWLWAEPRAR